MMLATVAAIVVPYLYSELQDAKTEPDAADRRLVCIARCCGLRAAAAVRAVLPDAAVRDGRHLAQGHGRRSATATCCRCRPRRRFAAWAKAWSSACTGVDCGGLKPFFMNSVLMVVPAVLISTLIGALNGYVLTQVALPRQRAMFALLLFGVLHADAGGAAADEPDAGLARHRQLDLGPDPGARGRRPRRSPRCSSATTTSAARRAGQGGDARRRRLLAHLLAHRAAAVDADHRRDADLAVHQDLERLPVRRGVLRRRQQADHRRPEQPGQHLERGQGIQRRHGGGDDRRRCPRCSSTSSPASTSCAASPPARSRAETTGTTTGRRSAHPQRRRRSFGRASTSSRASTSRSRPASS